MSIDEINSINSSRILTGLTRADYNYWQKLIKISASKVHKVEEPEFFLGKRLTLMNEDMKEKSSLNLKRNSQSSRQNLIHKLEFTKEYISNAQALTSEKPAQPSILRVGINDYYNWVTIVETNMMMHVILLGTSNGDIKCVFMTKSEETNTRDNELIKIEQTERERENLNAGGDGEKEPQDEFEFSLDSFDFVGHCSVITALNLKYDSSRFVSGALNGEIRVWDIQLRECISVCRENLEAVLSLKMSPKFDLFASSGSETLVYLWKESTGSFPLVPAPNPTILTGHQNDVCHLEFTSNMKYLLSSSMDCTLRVWEIETGECKRIIRSQTFISTFVVSLNSDVVLAATDNGELLFIDLQREMHHVIFSCKPVVSSVQGLSSSKEWLAESRIRNVSISPNEKYFVFTTKDIVSYCSMEEVYRIKKEGEIGTAQSGAPANRQSSENKKEYRAFNQQTYQNEKLDIIQQNVMVNDTIVVFSRSGDLYK